MATSDDGTAFKPSAEDLATFDLKKALQSSNDKIMKNVTKMLNKTSSSYKADEAKISEAAACTVAKMITEEDGIACSPDQARSLMVLWIRSGMKCGQCGEQETFRQQFDPEFRMAKCSRCRRSFYCDKTCQNKHWKLHKTTCKQSTQDEAYIELYKEAREDAKSLGLFEHMRNLNL